MRFASIIEHGHPTLAVVRDGRALPIPMPDARPGSMRDLAAAGRIGLERVREWAETQPEHAFRSLDDVQLGPAVPDPGAIYAIGQNYAAPGDGNTVGRFGVPGSTAAEASEAANGADLVRSHRPLVYAKLPSSVAGHGSVLTWDRSLSANVDAEVELGVVIGAPARAVTPEAALDHVFGYTCINDVSSRDEWLDGDQWLLGKSMAGFCPVGPWVVTPAELGARDLRLGCTIGGVAIQDGSTAQMRTSVAEAIAYLSRHVTLMPGDLIATGTPARLAGPLGPDRHLAPGDVVTVWIEGIGELTTTIA